MSSTPLRRSPLDAQHRAAGARMAAFGGWEMPIQYTGVLEEHRACRERAVVFDVSHLGSLRCAGAGAHAALQWAFTNDLDRIGPGRAQYTHLLDPTDAHVVDDVIIWWTGLDEFLVMPNASNTGPLVEALEEAVTAHSDGAASVIDITASRVVLAVQGPQARAMLREVAPALGAAGRFCVEPVAWQGVDCTVAGTGYTGEDGVEIQAPAQSADALWEAVISAGVIPAGLGARDTLRLEAGLALHGHELGPGITPLQANLGWVVRFDKGEFRGRAPLDAERARGVHRLLRGLSVDGRRPPRQGYPVMIEGEHVGEVTSGNFSPVLGHGIALAFVPPGVPAGTEVAIEARGTDLRAVIVDTPFVRKHA